MEFPSQHYIPSGVNRNCGVYMIKNIKTGNFYIGSSKNLRQRFRVHQNSLKSNYYGNRLIQKEYDETENKSDFTFSVIIYCKESDRLGIEANCIKIMAPKFNGEDGKVIQEATPEILDALKKIGEPTLDSLGRRKRCLDSERHKSITAQQPWVALGMSRRTWYRRGLNKNFKPE